MTLCFANTGVSKYYEESIDQCNQWIVPANGEWYDINGNLAMSIEPGYINACQIVKGFNFAGGYPRSGIFRIMESIGYRDVQLELMGDRGSGHQYLMIDKKTTLRRSKEPQYFESISGVYLGISKAEVLKLYGNPTAQENNYPGISRWRYGKEGFSITFDGDTATGVTIYKNSNRHFDRTGFNCNDSFQAYYDAYKLSRMPYVSPEEHSTSGAYKIGNGEYLFFDKDSITLSIFNN